MISLLISPLLSWTHFLAKVAVARRSATCLPRPDSRLAARLALLLPAPHRIEQLQHVALAAFQCAAQRRQ